METFGSERNGAAAGAGLGCAGGAAGAGANATAARARGGVGAGANTLSALAGSSTAAGRSPETGGAGVREINSTERAAPDSERTDCITAPGRGSCGDCAVGGNSGAGDKRYSTLSSAALSSVPGVSMRPTARTDGASASRGSGNAAALGLCGSRAGGSSGIGSISVPGATSDSKSDARRGCSKQSSRRTRTARACR